MNLGLGNDRKKRVFLTGASGLLGSHLVDQMLRDPQIELTVLVRTVPSRSFLGELKDKTKVQILDGDLFNFTLPASSYFDVVIHSAAMTSSDPAQEELLMHINFGGTQSVFQKLKGRFDYWIQVSSVAAMSDGKDPNAVISEEHWGNCRPTPYALSKLKSDEWIRSQQPRVCLVHPCYLIGRWDSKPSSGSILYALRLQKIDFFLERKKNFVAAADVAAGIHQLVNNPQIGSFLLGGENLPISLFLQMALTELGVEASPTVTKDPSALKPFMREFCLTNPIDDSKARRTFGYSNALSTREALSELLDYFEQYKMLKRKRSPIMI